MTPVLAALSQNKQEGKPCVVATIVQVEGPAYQREGARCVIQQDGTMIGILSGGCVEEELKNEASTVIISGSPRLISLDFSTEADLLFGFGSGCGGKLLIWLERFHPLLNPDACSSLLEELRSRETSTDTYLALTVVESADLSIYTVGQRWRENADHHQFQPKNGKAGLIHIELNGTPLALFAEVVHSRPQLSIIGTGEDAKILSLMAKQLNWYVRLVYHRTERAAEAYFPHVDEIHHIPRCDFSSVPISLPHYVVVMSHHFEIDLEAVKQFLVTPVSYIGFLGSRTRIKRLLDALENEGAPIEKRFFKKLHAPVGLDLGAKTPEEITLSIMAELVAFHNGSSGGFLKERRGWLGAHY
ncbi:MAG TPA: XdhC family protein [Sporolactobacillaceae bacterium]|nr:XdhC family protein [Sporolactobacillaceae bacterium]